MLISAIEGRQSAESTMARAVRSCVRLFPALARISKGISQSPARAAFLSAKACVGLLLIPLVFYAGLAAAAVPVHIVKTDLRPLIRAAAQSPVRFAVLVPHAVSTTTGGSWSTDSGTATWSYAVDVPTAVSLSFHAVNSNLPASALLVVRGAHGTTRYSARDLHRGQLWSRILPGEALQFELSVASADRGKVALNIVSLQAGYRAIGPGVTDHPYYRQLKQQQGSGNTACVTNYECSVTTANTPPAAATVGVIVGNLIQCTGTLINDVPGDNSPYLLTARHCETGEPGGGDPGAASSVVIYWDAISPCGATLGSLYDPGIPNQTGAQTVVEQQDAWLLLLDENPVVADAQFAGFDASGGNVQGGYTIHHALGFNKQFTAWFGQAAAVQQNDVLGTQYLSDFWETVNAIGNIGAGASGSGLFDQNNHLVGSLTLGRITYDPSSYESCPVPNPPAPNGSNGVADFTSLAAIWNSTADTTSSTGSATLQSVLDPNATGTLVTPSTPAESIQLSASQAEQSDGMSVELSWIAQDALLCTAGDGVSGDGWSGTLSASGSKSVMESDPGPVTYTLKCTYPNGRTAKASTIVTWVGPTPIVSLSGPYAVWTTRPAVLSWTSNVGPCSISGGGLSQSNLPTSGSVTTTQSSAGEVTYTVVCGPQGQGTQSSTVLYVTPSLVLEPTGTDRLLGQTFELQWLTYADTCLSSGGAPGDGWSGNAFVTPTGRPNIIVAPNGAFAPHVTNPGTYTYTLTCSAGSISVQQSVTVTFENNAPYTTASISPASVTYSNSPADYVNLTWDSNVSTCLINSTGVGATLSDPLMIPYQAQGSAILSPSGPGTFEISVSCAIPGPGTRVVSPTLTLTVLPPPPPTATISVTPTSIVAGQNITISYSSTNALNCAELGNVGQTPWGGTGVVYNEPPTGNLTFAVTQVGQYTLGVSCQSIDPNQGTASAQAQLTVQALSASLSATPTTLTTGSPLTLAWSSNGSSCAGTGGGANGTSWSGTLAASGSVTQTATTAGSFTYTITCQEGAQETTARASVSVSAPTSSSSNSSSGGAGSGGGSGGGGAMGLLELVVMTALGVVRIRNRMYESG